ncbi:MAG: hypothetical protein MUD01_24415, partial [Chloroflexaceae bacterium]|nr:hypothetical protein [Chloroflexaceae bacterium]
ALHHFANTTNILRQIHRILKPGGRFVAAGEPAIPIFRSERAVQHQLEEVDVGIIERRPKVWQYWWACRRAGFAHISLDCTTTFRAPPEQIYHWAWAVKCNLVPTAPPRYQRILTTLLDHAMYQPPRRCGQIAMHLNGENLLIQATKR